MDEDVVVVVDVWATQDDGICEYFAFKISIYVYPYYLIVNLHLAGFACKM